MLSFSGERFIFWECVFMGKKVEIIFFISLIVFISLYPLLGKVKNKFINV